MVQLLTLYTDRERNSQSYRQSDRQTYDVMMPITDHTMGLLGHLLLRLGVQFPWKSACVELRISIPSTLLMPRSHI